MTKDILLILTLLLVKTISLRGQSLQQLTPQQMRDDIDSLVKYINEAHPNPYYRYTKKAFLHDVQLVKNSLHEKLNPIAFYLKIEPLLGKLQDGHTDIHLPLQLYNSQNPFILPYLFRLSAHKPYIICNRAYHSFKENIPPGAEIVSINDVAAKKMITDIINLNTGERPEFRAAYGADYFENFYLDAFFNANGSYKVSFKENGAIKTIMLRGIRKDSLDRRLKKYNDTVKTASRTNNNYSLKLLDSISTAIISFQTFDWNGYRHFVDSSFSLLKKRKIKNLIIDLRGNFGGDSDVGDDFFQYILKAPFKQYSKIISKNSILLKQRLLVHRINKPLSSADSVLLGRPNGSYDTTHVNNIPLKSNPVRFNGHVYLLTDPRTFSSAADFAQCFKYYNRGLIIGEETGGLIKSYGDIVPATLPNSKLKMTVSSKLYYNVGAKDNDWHGVIPDVPVPAAAALKTALQIIKERQLH